MKTCSFVCKTQFLFGVFLSLIYFPVHSSNWDIPQEISDISHENYAQIAADDEGNAIALWTKRGSVYAHLYDKNLGWLPLSQIALITQSDSQLNELCLALDSIGNAIALWINNGVIEASYYTKASQTWSMAIPISDPHAHCKQLKVVFDPHDQAAAVWIQNGLLQVYQMDSSLQTWYPAFTFVNTYAQQPVITFDSEGNAFVLWVAFESDHQCIKAIYYNFTDQSWQSPQEASELSLSYSNGTTRVSTPSARFDRSGNAVAVWQVYDGYKSLIQISHYKKSKQRWLSPDIATKLPCPGNSYTPQIEFDTHSDPLILWQNWNDNVGYMKWVRYSPSIGYELSSAMALTDHKANASQPFLAKDDQSLLAVWEKGGTIQSAFYRYASGWNTIKSLSNKGCDNPYATFKKGKAWVIWNKKGTIQSSHFDGSRWSDVITHNEIEFLNITSAYRPLLYTDNSGCPLAFWLTNEGYLQSRCFDKNKRQWLPLNTPFLLPKNSQQITLNKSGQNLLVTWVLEGVVDSVTLDPYKNHIDNQTSITHLSPVSNATNLKVVTNSKGDSAALWLAHDPVGPYIQVATYNAQTHTWTFLIKNREELNSINFDEADLAIDEQGNISLIGTINPIAHSSKVKACFYTKAENRWLEPSEIDSSLTSRFHCPMIAQSPNGERVALWKIENLTGSSVKASYTTQGVWIEASKSISLSGTNFSSFAHNWTVKMDSKGNAIALWSLNSLLYASRYEPAKGWATSSESIVLGDPNFIYNQDPVEANLCFDTLGNAFAIWHIKKSDTQVSRYDVARNKWMASGEVESLSNPGGETSAGHIVFISEDEALAIWALSSGSKSIIQTSVFYGDFHPIEKLVSPIDSSPPIEPPAEEPPQPPAEEPPQPPAEEPPQPPAEESPQPPVFISAKKSKEEFANYTFFVTQLEWQAQSNIREYRLYRNSELIAIIAGHLTFYVDGHTNNRSNDLYELEAVSNEGYISSKASVEI